MAFCLPFCESDKSPYLKLGAKSERCNSRYTESPLCYRTTKKARRGLAGLVGKTLGGKLFFWFINLNTQVNMQEYSNRRAHIKRAS